MEEGIALKKAIVVTGSPCVGKTSVARVLALKLDGLHVDLNELVKREKLFRGRDEKRQTLVADMRRISERVKEIVESSESMVIVEGHYAMHVTPVASVSRAFVLRRHPEELKKLMEQRGFEGAKLWENLAVEILDVCLHDAVSVFGEDMVCEIDATGRTVEDVTGEIVAIANGEKACMVGTVDWLGRLEREGRLEEFLKEDF